MKQAIRLAVLAACASFLVACNTAEGVGKDIKAGGKAVEKTAKDVKKKL
jgi:entericidin B